MGHIQPGFDPSDLRRWLRQAGTVVGECQITSRERTKPYFEVVSAFAQKTPAERKKTAP